MNDGGYLHGNYLDVPAGTVCEVVKWDRGLALLRHPTDPRFYCREWPSWLTRMEE